MTDERWGSLASVVGKRLAEVRRRIEKVGVDPKSVTVLAVTKGWDPRAVMAARAVGVSEVGESYAQELLAKAAAIEADQQPRWHFLGRVQRNKLAKLAPLVHCYQGVASLAEGEAILAWAPGARVLVEVDYTGVRQGASEEAAPLLVAGLRSAGMTVDGLMTVAPRDDPSGARRAFRSLAAMAGELGLGVVSAGMSDDFEIAVSEGSNMVRLGTALFGSRPVEPYLEE